MSRDTQARIARSILEAKAQIHSTVGTVFGWVAGALGAGGPGPRLH